MKDTIQRRHEASAYVIDDEATVVGTVRNNEICSAILDIREAAEN